MGPMETLEPVTGLHSAQPERGREMQISFIGYVGAPQDDEQEYSE